MKKKFIIFLFFYFCTGNLLAEDFNISSFEVSYFDNENKIIATGDVVAKDNTGIVIYSDKATYLKKDQIIISEGNVKAINIDNTEINARKIIFDKKKNIITAYENVQIIESNQIDKLISEKAEYNLNTTIFKTFDETYVYLKNKYSIITSNAIYDKKKNIILSRFKTDVYDNDNNYVQLENFKYLIPDKTIRSQGKATLIDNSNHEYNFSDILIDINKNKSFGSDLKVKFDKNIFDDDEQDPRLFGNTAEITNHISTISKGVYTTCALEENKCPPWKINAKEIIHDKKKKTLNYKNAWLNFYDIPVLYFPLYFHPDPTVKRQSGFLRPHFTDSNVGSALNIPYFLNLGNHRDLTFYPRIYYTKDENSVFQFEYRHVTKNTNTIAEFSYNKGYNTIIKKRTGGSRNHLFLKSNIDLNFPNYDYSDLELNIKKTSNDTYLRVHNIFSELTKDYNSMHSFAKFDFKKGHQKLGIRFDSYENLTATNNRYEHIFPNIDYFTNLKFKNNQNEKLSNIDYQLRSYYKNYNADADELLLVNDFYYNSDEKYWDNGFKSTVEGQVKNTNYDSKNSSTLKDTSNYELTGAIALKNSLPLMRYNKSFKETLIPKIMLRYGPGHMRDMSTQGLGLNYNNLFNLNKISNIDTIENGTSLILGTEYDVDFKKNNHSLSLDIGQMFNIDKNENMPTTSSLQNKSSELVGTLGYNFDVKKKNSINYNFSIDSNYDSINYHGINGKFKINNFAANFDYVEERNFIGTASYGLMDLTLDINDRNSLSFTTRKNFRTDDTEFYNLIYQYETDCLRAGIQFNKDFYSYQDVQSDQKLLFTVTLIPIGDIPIATRSRQKKNK